MQTKTVAILLATYNGEKYIENQILSLLQQTYKNWILYAHDDGSQDDTVNILKKYALTDDRINIIEDDIVHHGAGKNFLSLVKYSEADYTIFCDQDDIWLENKICEMVEFSEENSVAADTAPAIVYADGYAFYDDSGEIDFNGISHNHAKELKDFLFFNGGYQGCSIMFNKAMSKEVAKYRGEVFLHDDLISLMAHALGKVYFLPKKLMLYRQHSNAVTGNKKFNHTLSQLLTSNVNYLISKKHYEVKKSFYEIYCSNIDKYRLQVFSEYINFAEANSTIQELIFLVRGGFSLNGSKMKLLIKYMIRRKFST